MTVEETKLAGCYIIKPTIFEDNRGYFFESYNQHKFEALTGINGSFVQDNQSLSAYGTIRGLHFQTGKYAQTKLVRVSAGSVLDVVLDLRKDSKTYLEWISVELSSDNNLQIYIPKGFAHGFSVMSPFATLLYKCDQYYAHDYESGIRYNDMHLQIDWRIPKEKQILSQKDLLLPTLDMINNNL